MFKKLLSKLFPNLQNLEEEDSGESEKDSTYERDSAIFDRNREKLEKEEADRAEQERRRKVLNDIIR